MISLSRGEIEALIDLPQTAIAIEQAYRATSAGQVNLPPVGHITFAEAMADCHIKFGHVQGDENFAIKVATGFPLNADQDMPTGNGLVLVVSAQTGGVQAVLHDEMLLTDIRTGLGGAIASRLLARSDAMRLLVVGTGPQALWQIKSHRALMPKLERIELWGRNAVRAERVAKELSKEGDVDVAEDLEEAAIKADIIVTATGSMSALIMSDWITAGTHITAVGADAPGKQELEIDLVSRADLVAVDLIAQCVDHGEVSHAIAKSALKKSDLVELGTLLNNRCNWQRTPNDITIADLTGIAAQDIAIANAVLASM